jgi:hypothetical protein
VIPARAKHTRPSHEMSEELLDDNNGVNITTFVTMALLPFAGELFLRDLVPYEDCPHSTDSDYASISSSNSNEVSLVSNL